MLKQNLSHYILNLPGWHTSRKLVVIESDDWGSIRMPSVEVYRRFLSNGIRVDLNPYTRYDCLESNEDLTSLFDILDSVKDKFDNPALITANTIMANPDFDSIRDSQYENYYFEPIEKTVSRYSNHDHVLKLYREGIEARIFRPQLHGREHLNVIQWMNSLNKGHSVLKKAFEYNAFGIIIQEGGSKRNNFMAALDYESIEEEKSVASVLQDAGRLFENLFGYKSSTFIAPCYIWGGKFIESTLADIGIQALQGIPYQYKPAPGKKSYDKSFRYTGQRNKYGQIQLVRNAFFEPSLFPNVDSVNECLKRIGIAFSCYKPAIIGSHRLNFMGGIDENNRGKNLILFRKLLKSIINKWPDVEFVSSDQLNDIIAKN